MAGTRWKKNDLLSWVCVCVCVCAREACVHTPNWWLQWPESHFNSGLCICFCSLLILPIVIIIFVFLFVQVFVGNISICNVVHDAGWLG